jgi:hypothetical protein
MTSSMPPRFLGLLLLLSPLLPANLFAQPAAELSVYRKIVDSWVLYDNSGPTPRLIDTGDHP